MAENNAFDQVNRGSISRRDFLKLAGSSLGGAALGWGGILTLLDHEAVEIGKVTFGEIARNPELTDIFLRATASALLIDAQLRARKDGYELSFNPERVSLLEIIKDGVDLVGQRCKVEYDQASLDYSRNVTLPRIYELISKFEASQIWGHDVIEYFVNPNSTSKGVHLVYQALGTASEAAYDIKMTENLQYAGYVVGGFADIAKIYPGSGMVRRARELAGSDEGGKFVTCIRDEIIHPYRAMRAVSDRRMQRLPTSLLFASYMGRSGNNVREAMMDTEIALKMLARNDFDKGESLYMSRQDDIAEACRRFDIFRDQYNLLGMAFGADIAQWSGSRDNENKDLSQVNKIGIYHPWGIADKLFYADAQQIKLMTMFPMLRGMSLDQGRLKVANDFMTLIELPTIKKYLDGLEGMY